MSAIDVACEVGKSIITDRTVVNATQNLITTTMSSGVQIASSAITGGSVSAATSAAGASISSAAAGVGNAVMNSTVVSVATSVYHGVSAVVTTIASSAAAPFVIGASIIAGLWWLCSDSD